MIDAWKLDYYAETWIVQELQSTTRRKHITALPRPNSDNCLSRLLTWNR